MLTQIGKGAKSAVDEKDDQRETSWRAESVVADRVEADEVDNDDRQGDLAHEERRARQVQIGKALVAQHVPGQEHPESDGRDPCRVDDGSLRT
jgi:hypothetical protein